MRTEGAGRPRTGRRRPRASPRPAASKARAVVTEIQLWRCPRTRRVTDLAARHQQCRRRTSDSLTEERQSVLPLSRERVYGIRSGTTLDRRSPAPPVASAAQYPTAALDRIGAVRSRCRQWFGRSAHLPSATGSGHAAAGDRRSAELAGRVIAMTPIAYCGKARTNRLDMRKPIRWGQLSKRSTSLIV